MRCLLLAAAAGDRAAGLRVARGPDGGERRRLVAGDGNGLAAVRDYGADPGVDVRQRERALDEHRARAGRAAGDVDAGATIPVAEVGAVCDSAEPRAKGAAEKRKLKLRCLRGSS